MTKLSLRFLCKISALMVVAIVANAYEAPRATQAPSIDGVADDPAWEKAQWQAINHFIIGEPTPADDFSGRFKIVWTQSKLFVLAEISDNVLLDRHSHPLQRYWEDDLFEVLIDEDASGGDHHHSYNAFAYHISLDNQIVDIGQNGQPRLFNEHVQSRWQRDASEANRLTWEASILIYDDNFSEQTKSNTPVDLTKGKKMGFMVAYCDADDPSDGREHFITSNDIKAVEGDKNRAYLDASVFGELLLIDD